MRDKHRWRSYLAMVIVAGCGAADSGGHQPIIPGGVDAADTGGRAEDTPQRTLAARPSATSVGRERNPARPVLDDGGLLPMAGMSTMTDSIRPSAQASKPRVYQTILVRDRVVPINEGVGRLAFDVPADSLSVTVLVFGNPNAWYGIDQWMDAEGDDLISADWVTVPGNEAGCVSCKNYTAQGQSVSATIAPNRPMVAIVPGEHRIAVVGWLEGFADDTATIRVIAKRGEDWPTEGIIDVNFYFTGAQGWTAESAPLDPYFQACLDRVRTVYERVGLRLGRLNFQDVDPSLASVSIAEGDDRLGGLMAQSNFDMGRGVHIFFVDEILTDDPEYPSIPGVAAAVPAPPGLAGTMVSGVAIATRGPLSVIPQNRFLDPPAIGQTIAHELGHLLGLAHTSEYDGTTHDGYDDTPENDNAYLMHADGTGLLISPQQVRTLMANPDIVHDE
ncbi:MAG: hypothetical protein VX589_00680 [Myxococcota bacterium]|nr:hypothetical protein [Myxococcota bacterium]